MTSDLISFSFADPAMWAVHVGVTEQPSNGAKSLAVERIIFHDRYRPKRLDYDVALMKLKTPLEFNGAEEVQEERPPLFPPSPSPHPSILNPLLVLLLRPGGTHLPPKPR